MAATDRQTPRGPVAQVYVTRFDGNESRAAARSSRLRGAARDPGVRAGPAGSPRRRHDAHARATTSSSPPGFLFTEGLIAARDEIASIRYCADVGTSSSTTSSPSTCGSRSTRRACSATSTRPRAAASAARRRSTRSRLRARTIAGRARASPRATIASLPDRLRDAQRVFESTGGIHAAGPLHADGEPVCVREDVGRHNAMDKLVGERLLAGATPLHGHDRARLRSRELRARAEGRCRRRADRLRRLCAVEPRDRDCTPARRHAGRVPARRSLQRLHASSPDRAALVGATPNPLTRIRNAQNSLKASAARPRARDPSSV